MLAVTTTSCLKAEGNESIDSTEMVEVISLDADDITFEADGTVVSADFKTGAFIKYKILKLEDLKDLDRAREKCLCYLCAKEEPIIIGLDPD